nr:immunoglobulin light chain junction region [Macaca mulatta]
CMQSLDIPWTF